MQSCTEVYIYMTTDSSSSYQIKLISGDLWQKRQNTLRWWNLEIRVHIRSHEKESIITIFETAQILEIEKDLNEIS